MLNYIQQANSMEILNRKAKFDYFIYDTYECGIVLKGSEIKSIRDGKANLKGKLFLQKCQQVKDNFVCYIK